MSIVSDSPRTRHQIAQLKAKQARQQSEKAQASKTAKPVNRVFGEGVFDPTPTAKILPGHYDRKGRYIPTVDESRQWAELSAQIEDQRQAEEDEARWEEYAQDMQEMEAQLLHDRTYRWTGNLDW